MANVNAQHDAEELPIGEGEQTKCVASRLNSGESLKSAAH